MVKGEGLVTFVHAGEKLIAVTLELVVLRYCVCVCVCVFLSLCFSSY